DSSFGLTGIASIGPVMAVGIRSVFSAGSADSGILSAVTENSAVTLGTVFAEMAVKTARGFLPLVVLIIVLQVLLLHFPKIKFIRICLGMVYSFIGIVIFLTGAEYGFTPVGKFLGNHLSSCYSPVLTLAVALILGAIVVCAEPAVWVLTEQVEQVTAGRIERRLVMFFLALGVSAAVCLAIVRILFDINYLWFVFIGIGLSLVLTFFCPPLFTGIAFDSGGVASGPMSTSFLLAFALGVSGSAEMGFGLVGLIAIAPLIAIQILGVIFRIKSNRAVSGRRKLNAFETCRQDASCNSRAR
ncbi:MAG: DUF1538 domain-containing protein, partial [Sphaerochaetaceae bacterium]|nr:DUF1538 domain-containing protein [Sphaerochaetaceae bacterium]